MARGLEPNGTAVPVDVPSLLDVVLAEANLPFSPNPCRDTNCAGAFSSVHTGTFPGSFVSSVKPLSKTGTDPLGYQSGPWGSEPTVLEKRTHFDLLIKFLK